MGPASERNHFLNSPELMAEKLLVRKIREEGDKHAFETLFRAYHKRLHGFAYTFVHQSETAEDIIQTIFLRIWEDRGNWDPPGTVKQYLFAAVRNEALNILRHKKVISDSEEEVIRSFEELKKVNEPYETADFEQFQKEVQQSIEKLPPRCKQIYLLNRRSGLTYIEIADHLNISINTVNTQMGRALQCLRDHLSDYLPAFIATGISRLFF